MALTTISITSPTSAEAGQNISFTAKVKNNDTKGHSFRIDVYFPQFAEGDVIVRDEYQWIWQSGHSGDEEVYNLSQVMPSKNAEILVYVYYSGDSGWVYDNYLKKTVTMTQTQPTVSEFKNLSVSVS